MNRREMKIKNVRATEESVIDLGNRTANCRRKKNNYNSEEE